jgi:PAS domain S-box-containing protein
LGMHRTTAGKIKVSLALDPDAYQQLKHMAAGPHAVGACVDDLIRAEVNRRQTTSPEHILAPDVSRREPASPEALIDLPQAQDPQQYQADVLTHITEAVITLDAARRVIGWNRAAEALYFWTAEEAIGRPVDEVIPREPVAATLGDVYRQLDTEGAWRGEIAVRRRDGTVLPVESTGVVIRDAAGQVRYRIGVTRDITERKQAELRQAAAQEEIRRLYEQAQRELAERTAAQTQLSDAARRLARQGERLHILHEIDRAILAAHAPAAIAQAAAEGVLRVTDAGRVNVALWQPQDETLEVLSAVGLPNPPVTAGARLAIRPQPWFEVVRGGQIAFEDDLAQVSDLLPEAEAALAQGLRSQTVIPLMVAGQPIGHLALARRSPGRCPDEELALARQIADSLAVAIHHARLNTEVQERRRQLQALSRRQVALQEEERRVLSRDLHDTSGQSITALKLRLGSLIRDDACSEPIRATVVELLQLTDVIAQDLHRLAVNLRPASLDRYGLVPALEQLLNEFRKQTGLQAEFLAGGLGSERLPAEIETALYRIVQEATTNIARYAQAARVSVLVQRDGDRLQVIVEDDGRGFDVDAALHSGRLGLLGMRERAEMLGGTLDIESRPGEGACILATVPARPAAAGAPEPPEDPPAALPAGPPVEPDPRLAEAAELARAQELSDALVEITTGMAHAADAGATLRRVLTQAAQALGCDNAHIALREGNGWELPYGYREGRERRHFSDLESPLFRWVERTRQALVVDDTRAAAIDDPLRLEGYGVKSYASMPLLAGDRLLGVLTFVHYTVPTGFHPSEIAFLKRLATLVALSLENAQLHDIEIRQRTELAHRFAELEAILDSLPDAVYVGNANGMFRCNQRALETLGFNSLQELQDKIATLNERLQNRYAGTGEPIPSADVNFTRALTGQRSVYEVISRNLTTGQDIIQRSAASPIYLDGQVIGAVAVNTDITETKRTEQALRDAVRELGEARDRLEQQVQERTAELSATIAHLQAAELVLQEQASLLDLSHDAIYVHDLQDATIRYWNRGAEEHYGWTAAEAVGQNSHALTRTVFSEPMEAIYAKMLTTGRWEGELLHTRRDGQQITVASRWTLKRDEHDQPVGVLETNNDISEQKHAESLLRLQKERLEIVHEIDVAIMAARGPAEIAQAAVARIKQVTQARRVAVFLCDDATQTAEVLAEVGQTAQGYQVASRIPLSIIPQIAVWKERRVAAVVDFAALPDTWPAKAVTLRAGIRSAILVPLIVGEQVIGLLNVSRAEPAPHAPEVMELPVHVANSLALAIHNARLHEQLQASHAQLAQREATLHTLSQRLVELQERERSYVADRLLNEAAQVLAALKVQMSALERGLKRLPGADDCLDEIIDKMDRVLQELHRLATELRPASLDQLGLATALDQYLTEFGMVHGLEVQFVASGLDGVRVPAEVETTFYRIAQEALANIARHAHATVAGLALTHFDRYLVLAVEDNGAGFHEAAAMAAGALGLAGMRERVQSVGGSLTIESNPGSGTTIIIDVPLDPPNDAPVAELP